MAESRIFLREGARAVIGDRDAAGGQQAAEALGAGCYFIRAAVSKAGAIKQLVDQTAALLGRIDFLVNCAGIIRYATAVTCTEEEWDEVLDVNLKSSFLCSKYAI